MKDEDFCQTDENIKSGDKCPSGKQLCEGPWNLNNLVRVEDLDNCPITNILTIEIDNRIER